MGTNPLGLGMFAAWRSFTRDRKFMERFGNCALHFPLSRRSDNADGLSRQSVAKTDLSRRSQAKTEALVSVLGKFGVSDQLRPLSTLSGEAQCGSIPESTNKGD
jgi:hypothetical protein